MFDPGAVGYGELLSGMIVVGLVVFSVFYWIKTEVKQARLRSPEGVRRINAEIARMEPIWARKDEENAEELRTEIARYEAEGVPPGYNLHVARVHLARYETPDPTSRDFERDNIRLGLPPGTSRFGLGITPEQIAKARRLTGA